MRTYTKIFVDDPAGSLHRLGQDEGRTAQLLPIAIEKYDIF